MWTDENGARYNRDQLRYPSDNRQIAAFASTPLGSTSSTLLGIAPAVTKAVTGVPPS